MRKVRQSQTYLTYVALLLQSKAINRVSASIIDTIYGCVGP